MKLTYKYGLKKWFFTYRNKATVSEAKCFGGRKDLLFKNGYPISYLKVK
jgi:hypothetical protein